VHWPPFLKAGVEYLRDTYPNYDDEKAQALAAFLIAVSGHQVQDAAWHSIGLLMGFIDEVAKVDCKNSFANAHETLDWGGDTIFGKRFTGHPGSSDWAFVFTPLSGAFSNVREIGKFRLTILKRYTKGWIWKWEPGI
jgi:glycosylphosphatidylinositol phospholipase D